MEMLDRASPVPLYHQLKQQLMEHFESGVFPIDKPIPTEIELAAKYQVSRATVRRAMHEMEHGGYIQRIAGKGTFILRTKINRQLTRMSSFTQDMQERGKRVTSQLLKFEYRLPPAHIAEFFDRTTEEKLLYIHRLRYADEMPIAINISYLKLPPGITIREEELTPTTSLWALLESKGVRLLETDKTIEATLANEERAALLQIAVGTPLLVVEGIAYTINHVPVEYAQVINSGERYKYSIHLER
ncbi:MAG: GntR family transcriptional regulator [Anaerolineae bacterium]|nr:GntR family transcriptional regulator [Anaerolineae bacterium]